MHFYLLLTIYISFVYTLNDKHKNKKRDRNSNDSNTDNSDSNFLGNFPGLALGLLRSTPPPPPLDIFANDDNNNDYYNNDSDDENEIEDDSDLQDATNAINFALQTIKSTNLVVQAASNALATCKADNVVDCDVLKQLYTKTQAYISVANDSLQAATSNANKATDISKKAKSALNTPIHGNNKKPKANANLSDLAAQIAQNAVTQAQTAAYTVVLASSQCGVIVNIRCYELPVQPPTSNPDPSSTVNNSSSNLSGVSSGSTDNINSNTGNDIASSGNINPGNDTGSNTNTSTSNTDANSYNAPDHITWVTNPETLSSSNGPISPTEDLLNG
jgi:hypothetical protein